MILWFDPAVGSVQPSNAVSDVAEDSMRNRVKERGEQTFHFSCLKKNSALV